MPASSTTRRSCISPQRPRTTRRAQRATRFCVRVAQLLLSLSRVAAISVLSVALVSTRVALARRRACGRPCDKRVANRLDQLVERLLPPIDLPDGILLDVAELLVGELEELLGRGAQCRAGQRFERRFELGLRLLASSRAGPRHRPSHSEADAQRDGEDRERQ